MDPSDRQDRQLGAQQSKTSAGAMRRQLATAQKRHASTDAHPEFNCTWKEKSERDLNEAALHGTYFTVRKLLKEGVDVNALCKTVDGLRTAMMQAAGGGHVNVLQLLLDGGAAGDPRHKRGDMEMRSQPEGMTAFLCACGCGERECIELLIKAGCEIEGVKDQNGCNGLIYISVCSAKDRALTMKMVLTLSGTSQLEECDMIGRTAFLSACEAGHLDCVQELLSAGCNTSAVDLHGRTWLDIALENGHHILIQHLESRGIPVHFPQHFKLKFLETAIARKNVSMVQRLLPLAKNVNADAPSARWPLILCAAASGNVEIVQLFIHAGAQKNRKCRSSGNTALMVAASLGLLPVIDLLLKARVDPNKEGVDGLTALMLAIKHAKFKQVLQLFVKNGVDINYRSSRAKSVFMSCFDRYPDTDEKCLVNSVTCLLECAQCNSKLVVKSKPDCWAALRSAVCNGWTDMTKLLISHNAPLETTDEFGNTAIIYAGERGHTECARALIHAGCNVSACDFTGNNALMAAALSGYVEVLQAILTDATPNLSTWNEQGGTALHCAVAGIMGGHNGLIERKAQHGLDFTGGPRRNHADCVEALVRAGADVTAKDCQSNTAAEFARLIQAHEILKTLNRLTRSDTVKNLRMLSMHGHIADSRSMESELHLASARGHHLRISQLLESPESISIDQLDEHGYTAFQLACLAGHTKCVEVLFRAGCDTMCKSAQTGLTGKEEAKRLGHLPILRKLKDLIREKISLVQASSSQVNDKNTHHQRDTTGSQMDSILSELCRAIQRNDMRELRILMPRVVDINAFIQTSTPEGVLKGSMNPLMIASIGDHVEEMALLLEGGAQMEVREPDDMCTAFHLACVNNASKCAELLIKAGCNTTSKNVDNNTGLYEAVMLNHVHVVVTLMDNKVPKETQNFQGMTALMCAVMKGHVECAEILVRHGASMSTKALNGASASSMLKRKKNIEMSRRLKVISEELTKSAATEAERKRREASEEDEQRAKKLQIREEARAAAAAAKREQKLSSKVEQERLDEAWEHTRNEREQKKISAAREAERQRLSLLEIEKRNIIQQEQAERSLLVARGQTKACRGIRIKRNSRANLMAHTTQQRSKNKKWQKQKERSSVSKQTPASLPPPGLMILPSSEQTTCEPESEVHNHDDYVSAEERQLEETACEPEPEVHSQDDYVSAEERQLEETACEPEPEIQGHLNGDQVEVYSISQKMWLPGTITRIDHLGTGTRLRVEYCRGTKVREKSISYSSPHVRTILPSAMILDSQVSACTGSPMYLFSVEDVSQWIDSVEGIASAETAALRSKFLEYEIDGHDLLAFRQKSLLRTLNGTKIQDNYQVVEAVLLQRDIYMSVVEASHADTVHDAASAPPECSICLEPFNCDINSDINPPRVLPCGHTFCQSCLQLVLKSVQQVWAGAASYKTWTCAECRESTNVKDGEAFNIPKNFALLKDDHETCQ